MPQRPSHHPSFPQQTAGAMVLGLSLSCALLAPLDARGNSDLQSGRVVAVEDGDTLTVRVQSQIEKVRLADIDAPELGQRHGRASRKALEALCLEREAQLEDKGRDRNGLRQARVFCNGAEANALQVREGMAWVYKDSGDKELGAAERIARESRAGLWQDEKPTPPWDWRPPKGAAPAPKPAKQQEENGITGFFKRLFGR